MQRITLATMLKEQADNRAEHREPRHRYQPFTSRPFSASRAAEPMTSGFTERQERLFDLAHQINSIG